MGLRHTACVCPSRQHLKHWPFHSRKAGEGGNLRVVGLWGEVYTAWREVGVVLGAWLAVAGVNLVGFLGGAGGVAGRDVTAWA